MNYATKTRRAQVISWLIWVIVLVVFLMVPSRQLAEPDAGTKDLMLGGIARQDREVRALSLWGVQRRLRKWAYRRYQQAVIAHRRAEWVARLVRMALVGVLPLGCVVDVLIQRQMQYQLGALPVLHALLEGMQVRKIVNEHCPTRAEVDLGTVVEGLVLNRLSRPLPLYQVSKWMGQSGLEHCLRVPAAKFNDDRLGRTLSRIAPHSQAIWQDSVAHALVQAEVKLDELFYDLTAFVAHGQYAHSRLIDFGFAHNTPMNKRKFKTGLSVSGDGYLPLLYALWSGRTTDWATVEHNLTDLARLFQRLGGSISDLLLVGDRANLDEHLVFVYKDQEVRFLAGLRVLKARHRQIVLQVPTVQFADHPLEHGSHTPNHWGVVCEVPFEHEGRTITCRGLVVLSGPMRTALRRTRATQLLALRKELFLLRSRIGQPRLRSVKSVQQRVNTLRNNSPAGKFLATEVSLDEQGQVRLRWWLDHFLLWQAQEADGRYLLVTNDWSLSPQQMFARYHLKDGVEKCNHILKSDLRVSPLYLHKDERIQGLLLISLLALLAYRLLERQARQNGLALTARSILSKLENLTVVETVCLDNSRLTRLVPLDPEQLSILRLLMPLLADLRLPRSPHHPLQTPPFQPLELSLAPPEWRLLP